MCSDGCSQDAGLVTVLSLLVLCAHKDLACNAKEQLLLGCSRGAALLQNCALLILGTHLQLSLFMAFQPGERLQAARMSSEGFG